MLQSSFQHELAPMPPPISKIIYDYCHHHVMVVITKVPICTRSGQEYHIHLFDPIEKTWTNLDSMPTELIKKQVDVLPILYGYDTKLQMTSQVRRAGDFTRLSMFDNYSKEWIIVNEIPQGRDETHREIINADGKMYVLPFHSISGVVYAFSNRIDLRQAKFLLILPKYWHTEIYSVRKLAPISMLFCTVRGLLSSTI